MLMVERNPAKDLRIMAVDDDEMVLETLCRMLEDGLGYTQVTAYNRPDEALVQFKPKPNDYDIAVVNWGMLGTDGITLAEKLKAVRAGLPVVLHTGYEIEDAKQNSRGVIDAYLQQPFTLQQLNQIIEKAAKLAFPPLTSS